MQANQPESDPHPPPFVKFLSSQTLSPALSHPGPGSRDHLYRPEPTKIIQLCNPTTAQLLIRPHPFLPAKITKKSFATLSPCSVFLLTEAGTSLRGVPWCGVHLPLETVSGKLSFQ